MLLSIELAVSMIDDAVIKKTIIMMRNYRRLKVGRQGRRMTTIAADPYDEQLQCDVPPRSKYI